MPRCHSCGTYTKVPHREIDGRTERCYCDLCAAEREWKFQQSAELPTVPPRLSWWEQVKLFFGLSR